MHGCFREVFQKITGKKKVTDFIGVKKMVEKTIAQFCTRLEIPTGRSRNQFPVYERNGRVKLGNTGNKSS